MSIGNSVIKSLESDRTKLNTKIAKLYAKKQKLVDQELVDLIFSITISIYENPWFKEKERTRDEVQNWVAIQLANFDIYTMPCGCSWGVLIGKEKYLESCQKEK